MCSRRPWQNGDGGLGSLGRERAEESLFLEAHGGLDVTVGERCAWEEPRSLPRKSEPRMGWRVAAGNKSPRANVHRWESTRWSKLLLRPTRVREADNSCCGKWNESVSDGWMCANKRLEGLTKSHAATDAYKTDAYKAAGQGCTVTCGLALRAIRQSEPSGKERGDPSHRRVESHQAGVGFDDDDSQ